MSSSPRLSGLPSSSSPIAAFGQPSSSSAPNTPLSQSSHVAGTPQGSSGATGAASSPSRRSRGELGYSRQPRFFVPPSSRAGLSPSPSSSSSSRGGAGGALGGGLGSSSSGIGSDRANGAVGGIDAASLSSALGAAPPSSGAKIWSTDVSLDRAIASFRKFIKTFKKRRRRKAPVGPKDAPLTSSDDESEDEAMEDAGGEQEPLYAMMISELVATDSYNINIDCRNIQAFDAQLYDELVRFPQEIIPVFDLVVDEYIREEFPQQPRRERTQVRTFNMLEQRNMRELNPEDIDSMVSIKGMVIRTSQVIPDLRAAFFQCQSCEATVEVEVDRGRVEEPKSCANCKLTHTMNMVHNRSFFADKQLIKLQETPDAIPEGETPHTISAFAFEGLVDIAKPGDRVTVTGIFKARPVRTNSRQRNVRAVYHTYVDVLHFQKHERGRVGAEDPSAVKDSEFYTVFDETDELGAVTEAREAQLRALAEDDDVETKLVRSLAPSVYQMEDVKLGILCQLFGGTNKDVGAGHGRFRGEINILLCGDPGTSKSQLLQYVNKIAPRGIYTSGKGSSAVGLTAYITKDPDTREMVLESGALVLSDRGICCIDEFDKMNESARSILHEVMEQQTVSIAKAGIVCTLNARTSVLASANPVNSRYDPRRSVVDNIQLPPTLLSRFDLIYLILDQPNQELDSRLADHLISLYYADDDRAKRNEDSPEIISMEMLTQYISYARKRIHPVLSPEASDQLVEEYVTMRKLGEGAGGRGRRKVVTATPRQLESMIRLSEALARMKLRPVVTKDDVLQASALMAKATQRAATDPRTGKIDMDMINTGVSASERKLLADMGQGIREVLDKVSGGRRKVTLKRLLREFRKATDAPVVVEEVKKALSMMEDEGELRFDGNNITLN